MSPQTKFEIDLTVQSFAYVAKQLARTPAMQYEQILREAEKHCSALRLVQRDVFDAAEQGLRDQALTREGFQRTRDTAKQAVAQGQDAIRRIAAQYAPQRMAA